MKMLSRRDLFLGASVLFMAGPAFADSKPRIHVVKGRGCGCCTAWVEILKSEGFVVTEDVMFPSDLAQLKRSKGIPEHLASCHTAEIGGYVIEGHVPAADIRRLLARKPDAIGLSVPNMPYGSPGMGPESERDAYDVVLIGRNGQAEIFNSYPAGTTS